MITSIWDMSDKVQIKQDSILSDDTADIHLYPAGQGIINLLEESEPTSAFISTLDKLIETGMNSRITCQLSFNHAYIENITHVLAIRLLHANLCKAHGIDMSNLPLVIEGHIKPMVRTEEIH